MTWRGHDPRDPGIASETTSLVEGLEGGELTAARLEELVDALGDAAARILQEIDDAAPAPAEPTGAHAPAPSAPAPQGAAPEPAPATERTAGEPREAAPVGDPLPEGAPIARRPPRTSARFAAVMMAIEGIE